MRETMAMVALALGVGVAGCGAAPGHETTPAPSGPLRPLTMSEPQAQLRGIDGTDVTVEIQVVITNPNPTAVTMRRLDGHVVLDGQDAAHLQVQGDEAIDPSAHRAFVLSVRIPLSVLAGVRSGEYTARGTLYADGGSGDGSLESPFEFRGPLPHL